MILYVYTTWVRKEEICVNFCSTFFFLSMLVIRIKTKKYPLRGKSVLKKLPFTIANWKILCIICLRNILFNLCMSTFVSLLVSLACISSWFNSYKIFGRGGTEVSSYSRAPGCSYWRTEKREWKDSEAIHSPKVTS